MRRAHLLVPALAFIAFSPHPVPAQTYSEVLLPASHYSLELCPPPCDCPSRTIPGNLSGSFSLVLIAIGDVFDRYELHDINWTAELPDRDLRITGSGSYMISSPAHLQRMSLTLSIDSGAPVTFQSDLAPLDWDVPNISIDVLTDVITCTQTTLNIRAVPRCIADTDNGSGSGIPDGGVGIEDLLFYLGVYREGRLRADVDDGTATGTPDGGVGIEDLLYYLTRYNAGC